MNAKFTIIIDSNTIKENTVIIKNMEKKEQDLIQLDNVISFFESE